MTGGIDPLSSFHQIMQHQRNGDSSRVLLKTASIALIMRLKQLSNNNQHFQIDHLTDQLKDATEALEVANADQVLDSLRLLMLSIYTIISRPEPRPERDSKKRPRTTPEADALVLAHQCIKTTAMKCGPLVIAEDPSIYLKLLTQLTLSLAKLSVADSTKKVEWWLEEKAVLGALKALIDCGSERKKDEENAEGEENQQRMEEVEEPVLPELDLGLLGEEEEEEERGGGGGKEEGKMAFGLEQMWVEVKRALVNAVGGGIVAQLIQTLLDVVANDRDRDVRLLALSTLESLVHLLPSPDVWRPFFPGVFGGLIKIALGDYKQGSKVTSSALRIALHLTAMLISPEANASLLKKTEEKQQLSASPSSSSAAWALFQGQLISFSSTNNNASKGGTVTTPTKASAPRYQSIKVPAKMQIQADAKWAKELQSRLAELLPILLNACTSSDHARVRRVLVEGLAEMMEGGEGLLGWQAVEEKQQEEEKEKGDAVDNLRIVLLDAFVILQGDEIPESAKRAHDALEKLQQQGEEEIGGRGGLKLASPSRILARIKELLSQLPSVAAAVSDRSLRSVLRLLKGYLKLLSPADGGGVGQQLLTMDLELVMTSLARALEPDRAIVMEVIDPLPLPPSSSSTTNTSPSSSSSSTDNNKTDIIAATNDSSSSSSSSRNRPLILGYYRGSFRNFRDEGILEEMRCVLRLLGRDCGPDTPYLVVDYVLGKLREGANQVRRRHSNVMQFEGRVSWALDRLPLVFIMNHVIQGSSSSSSSSSSTVEPATRLLLEDLLLTQGGVWHLPTGRVERDPSEAMGADGGGIGREGCTAGSLVPTTTTTGVAGTAATSIVSALPVEVLDCNARLLALLIEGIGDCCGAVVASGHGHERCLMLTLYPLVEKLGDPHPLVRQAALTTIHRLGQLVGAASVGDLLAENLDYLVEALCIRVRRSQGRRGVSFPLEPAVLEGLVMHAGQKASLALIKEVAGVVMDVVDVEGLGQGHKYAYGMMRVLHVVTQAIPVANVPRLVAPSGKKVRRRSVEKVLRVPAERYWRERIHAEFGLSLDAATVADSRQALSCRLGENGGGKAGAKGFFKEYHRQKAMEKDDEREGTDNDTRLEIEKLFPEAAKAVDERMKVKGDLQEGDEEEEEEDEEEDKPSVDEKLVLDVVDRCCYFLACPSLFIQHKVIIILREALVKLAPHRSVLLPTVHKVWPAIMSRLQACAKTSTTHGLVPGQLEENDRSISQLLLVELLDLIASLAGLCGNYLSFKFTEELWPLLRALLSTSEQHLRKKGALTVTKVKSISSSGSGTATIIERQLINYSSSAAEQAGGGGAAAAAASIMRKERETIEARAEASIIICLTKFAESYDCYRYSVPLVHDIGRACLYLLAKPTAQVEAVLALYKALMKLDAAALWPLLMSVAGWDITRRPLKLRPSSSSSSSPADSYLGITSFATDQERQLAGKHAKLLLSAMEAEQETTGEEAWCV